MAWIRVLKPQPAGELIISKLEGQFSFLDIGFTKELESQLDMIAAGKAQYKEVVAKLNASLDAELATQSATPTATKEETNYPCAECGKPMRRIAKGAHGAFWGCSGHPECTNTLPDAKGKPGKKKEVKLSEFSCPQCSKPLIHRFKKGKSGYDFWGCSGFKDGCRASFPNKENKPAFS